MPWAVILRAIFGWILVLGVYGTVDINFDGVKGGYFLKPLYEKNKNLDPLVQTENLILTGPSDVYNLKASSGPFEVHQVIQDDLIDTFLESDEENKYSLVHRDVVYNAEVSAHIVSEKLSLKWPKLQVLIHIRHRSIKKKGKLSDRRSGPVMCGHVYVRNRFSELSSICVLNYPESACVSGIDLPADWWQQNSTAIKVFYAFSHAEQNQECASASNSIVPGKAFENPLTSKRKFITNLYLSQLTNEFKKVKDQHILIYVPMETLDLGTVFEIPVKLEAESDLQGFVMRAKVRHGIKITGAIAKAGSPWQIHVDIHDRKKVGTVTAFLRDSTKYSKSSSVQDVFRWQMEVDDEAETTEMGRVIWSIEYEKGYHQEKYTPHDSRIVSRINIRRGKEERLVPVIKSGELLNFAVLTGKEQVYPLNVYTVSESDVVTDVSHHTVCHSAEEDVLKVASDCSSLYVDGSETRGSHNVTVIAKSGRHTAFTHVKVWIPYDPLDIQLSDEKLSQIRGWKVSKYTEKNRGRSRNKRVVDFGILTHPSVYLNKKSKKYGRNAHSCHLRLQQAEIKLYAKFHIVSPRGREFYKGRQASLLVTDVLKNQLRVSDSRIASLDGTLVQGQSSGRTEIQVLSPSGRVMAAKELRVGNDKVSIERLVIQTVAGISLQIKQFHDIEGAVTAIVHIQDKLHTKYQKAILDIALQYSDGTRFPLKFVNPDDYFLDVSTADRNVIGIAMSEQPYQPQIVAMAEGRRDLVNVVMKMGKSCIKKRSRNLALSFVSVIADFSLINRAFNDPAHRDFNYDNRASDRHDNNGYGVIEKPYDLQPNKNRDKGHKSYDKVKFSKNADSEQPVIPIGIDLAENLKQESPQTDNGPLKQPATTGLTPFEIGMYVILAVFCVAIAVFLVNCVVFMVKYKRKREIKGSKESVSQANDWVWIGRATLERNAINTKCSQTLMPVEDFNGNHTRPSSSQGSSSRDSSAQNSNRSSFVSTIKGSECSIRITANPLPETYSENENNNNPHEPEWDYEAMGMTYDELVDYFDNLKESTA